MSSEQLHSFAELRVKLDPGSKTTGIAMVNDSSGKVVKAEQKPGFILQLLTNRERDCKAGDNSHKKGCIYQRKDMGVVIAARKRDNQANGNKATSLLMVVLA